MENISYFLLDNNYKKYFLKKVIKSSYNYSFCSETTQNSKKMIFFQKLKQMLKKFKMLFSK